MHIRLAAGHNSAPTHANSFCDSCLLWELRKRKRRVVVGFRRGIVPAALPPFVLRLAFGQQVLGRRMPAATAISECPSKSCQCASSWFPTTKAAVSEAQ
jgi:hypothetical protein